MAGKLRHFIQRGDAFWARIVVPQNLRQIIGKAELRVALGSNRKIAERDLHGAVAAMQDQLAAARMRLDATVVTPFKMRPRPATFAQIAHTHFAEELTLDAVERHSPNDSGRVSLAWARDDYGTLLRSVAAGRATNEETQAAIGWAIAKFQTRGSTVAVRGTAEWRALARTLAQVQLEAIEVADIRDDGREPSTPKLPILAESPTPTPVVQLRPSGPALPILDLLNGYLSIRQSQGRGTEADRRWRPVFKEFIRYLGHDDARHITKADIAGWRDHLREVKKLEPYTIRNVHLAALRAVLGWAYGDDRLPENPAASVKIHVAKKVRTREKGLNDAEAIAILKVAYNYQPPVALSASTRESQHRSATKRWLPWLCALTGARVAEMAQLRGQDIQIQNGITFMRITPDAGSVKTGGYRDVPVHPQLVALGFIDFAEAAGSGPLFYDNSKIRRSPLHPSKIVASHLAAWIRSLNIIDMSVDPSHGWRHRFKTVGREAEISDRVLDALQGHAGRTAGDDYGDVTIKTRDAAIKKMPCYDID